MTLPNLLVPGAAKSGTSSFHESLRQHPEIFMSDRKEPHYFSREFSPGGQGAYENLFAGSEGYAVRGESSTSYLVIPDAPKRISAVLDRPRIIFVLRNPVDRVISHYRWLQSLGLESRPLKSAFTADRDSTPSMDESILDSGNYRFYYQHSSYGSALDRFLRYFDRKQIKIVSFERYVTDNQEIMNGCFSFLGVRGDVPIEPVRSNTTRSVTWIRGAARSLARALHARHPWARHISSAGLRPARAAITLAERASLSGGDAILSQDDRKWLVRQLADEVAKLRLLWGEDFTEWCGDFPLQRLSS